MFQSGDYIYVNDSAQEDCQGYAWNYIKNHREAQVICALLWNSNVNLPESETQYVLVWPEVFRGGWDCWNNCLPGYGQIVTQKHLDLNFEKSRPVVTVPQIKVEDL